MKTFFHCLLFLFALTLQSAAQKNLPKFGKVDKVDLEMIDCDFDKGAAALVLIDWGSIYYDRGTVGFSVFKTVYKRRTRIKILKERGLTEADIEIPYYTHNNEEKIFSIEANTYNLDESGKVQTTEVKKSSIYSKKIDNYHSKMILAFPEVKVGSIIEYSYTVERETYNLRDWYFQGRIPVRYSEYELKVPQIFRFSVQAAVVDSIEDNQKIIDESISMDEGFYQTKSLKSNYIMHNLPGIKDEPFMGSPKDYMQHLEFQMSQINYNDGRVVDIRTTWKQVVKKELMERDDFGLQLNKKVSGAEGLLEKANKIIDPVSRMNFIYDHVRKNISWNDDDDIYTQYGISKAWENKTGNMADINLLLIKLLTDANLHATPILFSTRMHGLVTPLYPNVDQFNTVQAHVSFDDKYYVLDATNKLTNYKLVPEKVVNSNGFLVTGESGKWIPVVSGKSLYKVMAATQGIIDAQGNMAGNSYVNCYEYARIKRCEELAKSKEKFKDDYFLNPYASLKIDDISINNVESDSLPLEQKIKFNVPLRGTGDYLYFSINLFSDLEKNPFVAKDRLSDVDFGVNQEYLLFGNYTIPAEFSFDGVPENMTMVTSDGTVSFNRNIQVEDNLLNVRISVEFKKTFYPVGSYDEFAEFYKKLIDKLNEQVVIKKKAV
ncbi:MAG: DUF3857 domain-containing protein [Chitinophagaceae bacterium]|nr:DUF3857 domain-containing protein [Chitinophagaceae bacterium]